MLKKKIDWKELGIDLLVDRWQECLEQSEFTTLH